MKAQINKTIIKIDGKKEYSESLYNFSNFRDAQNRLKNIASVCRYPIIEQKRNLLKINRYNSIFIFEVVKQK